MSRALAGQKSRHNRKDVLHIERTHYLSVASCLNQKIFN